MDLKLPDKPIAICETRKKTVNHHFNPLHLLYANDIGYSCNANILSFADDTTIFSSHANINSLFVIGNKDINDIHLVMC